MNTRMMYVNVEIDNVGECFNPSVETLFFHTFNLFAYHANIITI